MTVQVDAELLDQVRDAVVWLPSQGLQATMASLTEEALRRELDRLRAHYNDGNPFPQRQVAHG